ncbi:MAG: PLP-dependent aminotransferase family protein [Clostridium sp.]|nr:PLP-dependent aminotransferase family protein [Clostridium sp.]MCM1547457.1 PLP-dependent aminotransferase family protein [Ruminococcus sp.]
MNYKFSDKVSGLQASAIREILKYTSEPGVISFAAGNPAPEAFPTEEVAKISADILKSDPILALQYSISEGYTPLRNLLKDRMSAHNCFNDGDDLIITSGAQQAIELACKVLCNEGDTLIAESPSFIGSLNAFRSYNVNLVGVEQEAGGMKLDVLEDVMKNAPGQKIIYVIPNFQNPSGTTMSYEKRKGVYELACRYNGIIIEDNPYGDLRFAGEDIPSIKSLDKEGRVIYVGSFSKILAPGLRVGYACAPKSIFQKMVVCKQVSDVHTGILSQLICYRFMSECDLNEHFAKLRGIYKKKCGLMIESMEKHFSSRITFTRPEGGLFIWAALPEGSDMTDFCTKAVKEHKIAVVPGTAFMINETDKTNSFRLNFSTPTDEDIVKGIEILGKMTKAMLD